MSITTSPTEEVSDRAAQSNNPVLECRSWNDDYVGEDTEGRHHHVEYKRGRIVVTESRSNHGDSGAVPVFSLEGPILRTEAIELGPIGDGGEDLRRWIQFIDQECGGWADRPVSAANQAQDVLEEIL
ncbi:hypothetical protein [Natrinema halophilum]|uniref:Uncharacterized protein n=1 Tax=Natrinema halophilum TaxID=1699371 RepID=A0A7D5KT83_9EURY|nr:hypothetical protein [Natrinema halophilum]QLG50244.1 hypothetical protein HYG82_16015 [Natrinema halophilum]